MLGLDVLVNVANVVYLFSYSVRDILWLRILTVAGAMLLMPYYYFQAAPLWAPISWNAVFISINIYWITRLLLDRRPVPFSDEERRLYRVAMRNVRERDAFRLLRMGAWSSLPAGATLLTQGHTVESLVLIVEGEANVEMDGVPVDSLGQGRFLGGAALLSRDKQFAAPVSVTASRPLRVIVWQFAELKSLFEKNLELEADIEACLGLELSRFLQTARTQLV